MEYFYKRLGIEVTWITQVNKSEMDNAFPKRNLDSESSQNI